MDGPRSGWLVGSPPSKPYGQEVDDSQRETAGVLGDTCWEGENNRPKESP